MEHTCLGLHAHTFRTRFGLCAHTHFVSLHRYADFELLNSIEKTSYVLGSELWEKSLVREYTVNV